MSEELAAALAGPVGQFSQMLTWTAQEASALTTNVRRVGSTCRSGGGCLAGVGAHSIS